MIGGRASDAALAAQIAAFRLLLVEDNPGDAELTRERLANVPDYSIEVMHVTRLSDAIDAIEHQHIDAAILDLNLPDSTGIDTLRKLRHASDDVAIVVVSGNFDDELRRIALREGAQDFLGKNEPASRLVARSFLYALERHRTEAQHRQVEMLVAANPDAVVVTDTDGVVQLVNEAAIVLFDRPREVFVGSYLGFPMRVGSVSEIELTRRGERHTADMRVVGFEWNRKPAYLASVRDTTEQKRLGEQLRQAQKMEAVGLLAGGVAHDFNNLLLVVLFYAELLRGRIDGGDSRREDVEEILRTVERAQALTGQLLAFSRRRPIKPRVVDLSEVVISMTKLLQRTLPTNFEIVALTPDGLWPVLVDPGQIEQLLMNLAFNARDAMPSGGKLTIGIDNVALERPTETLQAGRYVAINVADSGAGIVPEHLERIFEPFFTTKEAGKGTGLGLATCYGIARQAGGDIRVESAPGAGTRFTVLIPRSSGMPEPMATERDPVETLDGTETVLLVEDNSNVRRSAARILRERGYQVIEATNGEQALRLMQQCKGKVDLVLTDIVMPYMTGTELAERLDISHPHVKIIFTSGYSGEENVFDLDRPILIKPYPPRELLRKVRTVLDTDDGACRAAGQRSA